MKQASENWKALGLQVAGFPYIGGGPFYGCPYNGSPIILGVY